MAERTPTTETIRNNYSSPWHETSEFTSEKAREEFNRWLAAHDAEVWAERDAAVARATEAEAALASHVGPARIVQMPRSPETDRRYWEVYCPSCATHECMFEQGDTRLTARRDEHNREHSMRSLVPVVVAEEPEWEYGYDSIADAEAERPSVRRRKAGPWVPVKRLEDRR